MKNNNLTKMAQSAAVVALCGVASGAFAHTSLQTNTINENTRTYNNTVIGHGCDDPNNPTLHDGALPVIAHSVVFPDGVDSIITRSDSGTVGPLSNYVAWGNKVQAIQSNDVFDKKTVLEKVDGNGNVVGFSYTNGKLPGNIHGLVPFKTDAIVIAAASCVSSVTFKIGIADICKKTPIAKFDEHVVNFWTPVLSGSNFNSDEGDTAASLKVNRTSDYPTNAPEGDCKNDASKRYTVTVTPSANQLNRDMPIPKYWGEK